MKNPLFQLPIVEFEYAPIERHILSKEGDKEAEVDFYQLFVTFATGKKCAITTVKYNGVYLDNVKGTELHQFSKENIERIRAFVTALPPVVDCEDSRLKLERLKEKINAFAKLHNFVPRNI